MRITSVYLWLVLSVTMTFNEQVMADGDAPAMMEAVIHAMIEFRKEILENLKLSLEYHTDQLEEIKYHMEHVIEKQENRMKKENNEIRRILGELRTPGSCSQVTFNSTGAYYINPYEYIEKPILVLCNFENNFNRSVGWTVFQRRMDGSANFSQNWTMYKNGFGDVSGEHWLGLENLHVMTKTGRHELLVLLEDFEGNSTYALYNEFKIGSEEEKYKLTVGNYSGPASDSLTGHNGIKFSTFDLSNSEESCAKQYEGGWWFKSCSFSHLNGQYYPKENHLDKLGVQWHDFPHANYSLKSTTMMFRSRT